MEKTDQVHDQVACDVLGEQSFRIHVLQDYDSEQKFINHLNMRPLFLKHDLLLFRVTACFLVHLLFDRPSEFCNLHPAKNIKIVNEKEEELNQS